MNLHDWIDEVVDVLELDDIEVDEGLLADVARTAARHVDPAAGPVTAYLLGLAAADRGAGPAEVESLAARVESLARAWNRPPGSQQPAAEPPADQGGDDYVGELDLGVGDDDDRDDLAEAG